MSVVLVLDDRADDRTLMAILLGYANHRVLEAATGEVALELAREHRPDLIITDILMPGMNGYEFVRRLREEPSIANTPVIFYTANYLEREVSALAASCGVHQFIGKPCSPDVALATVADALGHTAPEPSPPLLGPEFEREQLRVVNNKLAEKIAELARVSAHRRHLLGLVMHAQEEERRRIADGIHDDSLQSVVAVGLRLGAIRRRVGDPAVIEALEDAQETVKLAAQRLRSLLFELRPPELERRGIGSTLRAYLEHVQHDEGLDFIIDDCLHSNPDPETREFVCRLAREVLMNVRKHARASRVEVTLTERDGKYGVRVRDNGIGFDPAEALRPRPGHLGLAALTERIELAGGAIRIETALGAGATVDLELPVDGERPSGGRAEPPGVQLPV
jgi:signal transduction histidine kinase